MFEKFKKNKSDDIKKKDINIKEDNKIIIISEEDKLRETDLYKYYISQEEDYLMKEIRYNDGIGFDMSLFGSLSTEEKNEVRTKSKTAKLALKDKKNNKV